MGRMVDTDDLVGATEIVDRLGRRNARLVHDWRARDATFPAPVVVVHAAHLWLWSEVQEWARRTGRLNEGSRHTDA